MRRLIGFKNEIFKNGGLKNEFFKNGGFKDKIIKQKIK